MKYSCGEKVQAGKYAGTASVLQGRMQPAIPGNIHDFFTETMQRRISVS